MCVGTCWGGGVCVLSLDTGDKDQGMGKKCLGKKKEKKKDSLCSLVRTWSSLTRRSPVITYIMEIRRDQRAEEEHELRDNIALLEKPRKYQKLAFDFSSFSGLLIIFALFFCVLCLLTKTSDQNYF